VASESVGTSGASRLSLEAPLPVMATSCSRKATNPSVVLHLVSNCCNEMVGAACHNENESGWCRLSGLALPARDLSM
jgi:hypothetical protein